MLPSHAPSVPTHSSAMPQERAGDDQAAHRIPAKSSEHLDLEWNIDLFCHRALGREADIATGEDGRRSVALVQAALRSARNGRPVKLRL